MYVNYNFLGSKESYSMEYKSDRFLVTQEFIHGLKMKKGVME